MDHDICWLTEHPSEPVTLVTGRPISVIHRLLDVSGAMDSAVWSELGHGWVIPSELTADIEVAAGLCRVICRYRRAKGE